MPVSSASVVFFACSATTWQARRLGLLSATGTVPAPRSARLIPNHEPT
jgi:hypothetical protein